jgi:hypothetical protein
MKAAHFVERDDFAIDRAKGQVSAAYASARAE